jgi:hypothetical protein
MFLFYEQNVCHAETLSQVRATAARPKEEKEIHRREKKSISPPYHPHFGAATQSELELVRVGMELKAPTSIRFARYFYFYNPKPGSVVLITFITFLPH